LALSAVKVLVDTPAVIGLTLQKIHLSENCIKIVLTRPHVQFHRLHPPTKSFVNVSMFPAYRPSLYGANTISIGWCFYSEETQRN